MLTVACSDASSVAPAASVSNTAYAATNGNSFNASPTVSTARNVTLTVDTSFLDTSVDPRTRHSFPTRRSSDLGPSDAASTHITDTVDNRLNVTSVSDSGAGQACAASSG